MNNTLKVTLALIFSLIFFACSEDNNKVENTQLVDNSETIAKIINSFDKTVEIINTSNKLSNEEIGNIFIQGVENQGLSVRNIDNTPSGSSDNYNESSNEYKEFVLELVDAPSYSSKSEYLNHLSNLLENVKNSDLIISEKQTLVNNILLTNAFVNWMETLAITNKSKAFPKSLGWWSSWGKCAAGIAGGAILGRLAGAAAGSVIPVLGTAVGAIIGAIGGGLSGAAASCYVNNYEEYYLLC